MKTDIIINYEELTKDKELKIKIINARSKKWQYSIVKLLIVIVNIFSPVKFTIYYQ